MPADRRKPPPRIYRTWGPLCHACRGGKWFGDDECPECRGTGREPLRPDNVARAKGPYDHDDLPDD